MYITTTSDIVPYINANPNLYILVAKTPEIPELLIQDLVRTVNGVETKFLSLRNIIIYPAHQGQGIMRSIIKALIDTGRPILIHNVINVSLRDYFTQKGYVSYIDHKNDEDLECFIVRE